jgi:hypothetical protein
VPFGVIGVSFRRDGRIIGLLGFIRLYSYKCHAGFPPPFFYGFLFAGKCFKTPPQLLPSR